MRFSDALLDEIRARLPMSSVVGRRVKLRKQGRELAGLSPFWAQAGRVRSDRPTVGSEFGIGRTPGFGS